MFLLGAEASCDLRLVSKTLRAIVSLWPRIESKAKAKCLGLTLSVSRGPAFSFSYKENVSGAARSKGAANTRRTDSVSSSVGADWPAQTMPRRPRWLCPGEPVLTEGPMT